MKRHCTATRPVYRPLALLLMLALTLFAVAGCGDKEPEQRKAFAAFLNEKILSRKGVSLPELSREEKNSFGEYAAHYEILTAFQAAMKKEADRNARELLALAEFEDLASLAKRERSMRKGVKEAEGLQKSITALRKKTDAARDKLSLPDGLAPAYNAAYDKVVTLPAAAAVTNFAAVSDAFSANLELLDFINANHRDMEIDGKNINLRNPGLKDALQAKMTAVNEKTALQYKAYADMMRTMLQ